MMLVFALLIFICLVRVFLLCRLCFSSTSTCLFLIAVASLALALVGFLSLLDILIELVEVRIRCLCGFLLLDEGARGRGTSGRCQDDR